MSPQSRPEHRRTVVRSLARPGPISAAFGIEPSLRDGPPAAGAFALLDAIAGDTDRVDPPIEMDAVRASRSELDAAPLTDLAAWIASLTTPPDRQATADRFGAVFDPMARGILDDWAETVEGLRVRRLITDLQPSPEVIRPDHILFTANALVTVARDDDPGGADHVFDHPMPLDVEDAANEVIHGLAGLDAAMGVERARGTIVGPVAVVVSVAVTHERIAAAATDMVRRSVRTAGPFGHLEVHVIDEPQSRAIVDEILAPAVGVTPASMSSIGAGGSYGRHFSFLKAIAALWSVALPGTTTATFKIDLDQVFPQDVLVRETGTSALELLADPRWGATGADAEGRAVRLGMLAGALVDAEDIDRGLFTPDVPFPTTGPSFGEVLHRKVVSQAVSTQAEMMDRGGGGARQRIHVTGGVSGIRIDALRTYRPFTPTFVARAEDQAYVLSVFEGTEPRLRTLHAPGLFMRHDKAGFAADAIARASADTTIGDLERTVVMSGYVRELGLDDVGELGPFTGSYVSPMPTARPLMQLAMRIIDASAHGDRATAEALWDRGLPRLMRAIRHAHPQTGAMRSTVASERAAWNHFHDAIDIVEVTPELRGRLARLLAGTRVD